jgi:predicted MPP superfamily phosphohydrolase
VNLPGRILRLQSDTVNLTKRQFLRMTAGLGLGVGIPGTGLLAYATGVEPHRVVAEHISVRLSTLPTAFDGFRIALLADFHLYPFTTIDTIQESIQIANRFKPDLVLLAGDFIYGAVDAAFDLVPLFHQLDASKGVFAVLGNHDIRKGPEIVSQALAKGGVEILRNRGVTLQLGSGAIYLAGIDSVFAGAPRPRAAFDNRKSDLTSIVLLHEPDYIEDLVENRIPVDLQLSGHSHGGQVRLPLSGPLMLPPWGQLYDRGLYRIENAQIYTTRGIGMVGVPVRFNCPPEVSCITLTA